MTATTASRSTQRSSSPAEPVERESNGAGSPAAPGSLHTARAKRRLRGVIVPRRTRNWGLGLTYLVAPVALMWTFDKSQIGQLTLGLGSGALIAAIALGVVLTYKGAGVVNFSNGAVAIYAAYIFHGLRGAFDNGNGKLYLPPLPNPLAVVEGVWNSFVTRRSDWIDLPNWPTKVGRPSRLEV